MSRKFSLSLFIFFFLIGANAFAQGNILFPKTRLQAHQTLYSGEKGQSFAEAGAGWGVGITSYSDGRRLAPFLGLHLTVMTGRQTFLDNETEVSASFNSYLASTEIGANFYPIERRTRGMNVYISGAGLVGYNFVSLSRGASLSSIPYSDQSFSGGYALGMGAEWILSTIGPTKWTMTTDFLFKKESAVLLKKQFDLSSIVFSVGFGW